MNWKDPVAVRRYHRLKARIRYAKFHAAQRCHDGALSPPGEAEAGRRGEEVPRLSTDLHTRHLGALSAVSVSTGLTDAVDEGTGGMKTLGYLCVELGLFFALWMAIGVRDLPLWRVILVGAIVGLFVSLGEEKGQAA